MLSYSCQTAVRAVVYLASREEEGDKASIREIAEQVVASEHTVGKLLQKLVREDIIKSLKGPTGGFYISKEQRKQRIIAVIQAIGGREVFEACGLGFHRCSASHPCPIHDDYKKARVVLEQVFKTKTITDLARGVNGGRVYLFG